MAFLGFTSLPSSLKGVHNPVTHKNRPWCQIKIAPASILRVTSYHVRVSWGSVSPLALTCSIPEKSGPKASRRDVLNLSEQEERPEWALILHPTVSEWASCLCTKGGQGFPPHSRHQNHLRVLIPGVGAHVLSSAEAPWDTSQYQPQGCVWSACWWSTVLVLVVI